MKQPWIQAAIDVEDIALAKKIAFMALDSGAEWLEVGTPLLYRYGHEAIGMLRQAVGKNAVLVADYKSPFAGLCVPQAAKQGVDYVMLALGYNDWALEQSMDICRQCGVEPVFDMAVKNSDLREEIQKLVRFGARYIFSHCFSSRYDKSGQLIREDNFLQFKGERNYILGISSDDLEEAQYAVRSGADWITFGWVLRKPDPAVCRHWIDTIKSAR